MKALRLLCFVLTFAASALMAGTVWAEDSTAEVQTEQTACANACNGVESDEYIEPQVAASPQKARHSTRLWTK